MKYRWVGKNVDLDVLGLSLERFLVERGFLTKREFQEGGQVIAAAMREKGKKILAVTVRICGSSDDFEIDFSAGDEGGLLAKVGSLATLFGFGFLLRSEFEKRDCFRKLENDFWVFVDMRVADLAVSASHS